MTEELENRISASFKESVCNDEIVTHLVDSGLITSDVMRSYLVVVELKKMIVDENLTFRYAVYMIAKKYELTQRHVRRIYKNKRKFEVISC